MARETVNDPERVRRELGSVLSSETFAQSESLKRFLRHVVEAKLDGREEELKELSLGTDVFERGEKYDPRIDPVVRVQATRLRSKLRDYYQAEGARAEVEIELPKGSYVPAFLARGESLEDERTSVSRRRWLLPPGIAAVVLVLAVVLLRGRAPSNGGAELRSIAILPFTDMSPDSDHEYYGDGLAEEITTTLAGVEGLSVVPRTSAFRFKGSDLDLRSIASELGADAVLQGSVRRSKDALRIQVQLLRGLDGRQIWSRTYDRRASDAFEVQAEIAGSVARAVEKRLGVSPVEDEHYVPTAEAYEDYLRGTFEREKNTPASLARSIQYFESAIDRDPDFAPAHAGLVESYVSNVLWGFSPPSDTREAARVASERAVALQGGNPEALAAAALYRMIYEWDFKGAETLLERGFRESGPDNGPLHLVRGVLLDSEGKLEEASRDLELAERKLPRSPLAKHLRAAISFQRGSLEEARAKTESLLEWAPDYPLALLLLSRVEQKLGRSVEALEALSSFERSVPGTSLALASRAVLLAREGRTGESRELLSKLESLRREVYLPPAFLARVHAALGDLDEAFRELERAADERSFPLLLLTVDPDYEPLRAHPRYRALVSSLGLGGASSRGPGAL
jgi:serine/threonine-protein kinase